MNNRFLRLLQLYVGLIDIIFLNAVFFFTKMFFISQSWIDHEVEYLYLILFLNASWLLLVSTMNIYSERYILSFEKFTKTSFQAYLYFVLLVILYLFFFRMFVVSRVFVMVVLSVIPLFLIANRFIYLVLFQYFKKRIVMNDRVVVIGYNNLSKKLVNSLEAGFNKKVIGFCEEFENVKELSYYPILSNINNAFQICQDHQITEIYSTIAPEHNSSIYKLMQAADENCIRVKIVPDLGFFINRKIHIDYIDELPVITLRKEPLEDLGNRIKKRFFDIIISFLVVVFILSWLIPLIGLLIKFESKGPIFFKQLRTGKNNKSFLCFKFRSMYMNDKAHHTQASKNDHRLTRIGKFLRRTSLDEFPQFMNVLNGQMSLVGPRPHMLKHTDEYSKLIGQYMVRQFLKPGITGWAQVNGFRGETRNVVQMQKRVEHDLWYMEHWNLFLDLRIMFMTVFNTIKGDKNAY